MNISNGHNGAQGHTLPEKHNTGAFAYGLAIALHIECALINEYGDRCTAYRPDG